MHIMHIMHIVLGFHASCCQVIAMRVCEEGLEYLHTREPAVIHRDIKGSNILIGDGTLAMQSCKAWWERIKTFLQHVLFKNLLDIQGRGAKLQHSCAFRNCLFGMGEHVTFGDSYPFES